MVGITNTYVNRSNIWDQFTVMDMKINMRKTSKYGVSVPDLEACYQWTIRNVTVSIIEDENLIQQPEKSAWILFLSIL